VTTVVSAVTGPSVASGVTTVVSAVTGPSVASVANVVSGARDRRTAVADGISGVARVGSSLTTGGASGRAVARVATMSPNAGAVRG